MSLFRSPVEPLGLLLVLLGVAARHRRPARPLAPAALPPALAAVPPPSVEKVENCNLTLCLEKQFLISDMVLKCCKLLTPIEV